MTSRTKRKLTAAVETVSITPTKRVENSWTLLIKDSLFENDNFTIVTLPHPGNGQPTKYCFDDAHNKIYEVVTFSEPHRSWFVGETVKSDGSLLMVTPVNPLFLVLPRLKELCTSRAIPLQDLLSEKGFEKLCNIITNLNEIADLKGPLEMKAYKYNEEKALTWLEKRVYRLAKALKEKNVHVGSGALSATFVASNICNETLSEEFYLKYALGMISGYLQEEIVELLEKKFDFKPELIEQIGNKRKSEAGEQNDSNKRVKSEHNMPNSCREDTMIEINSGFSEPKKPKPLTAKEKARQKATSGTKTLSAFFAKKN